MPSGSYSVLIKNKISEFNKVIKVDSDKSISIRSFLIGAISNDISEIKNPLDSDVDRYLFGSGLGYLEVYFSLKECHKECHFNTLSH